MSALFSPRVNCKAIYIQTVMFQDMPVFSAVPVRGYTLHNTGDNLAILRDHPGIRAGTLTAQSIAEHVPSFVQLDACGAPVHIDGGWESPRCSVLVEIRAEMVNGENKLFRLRGYTNSIDFSYTDEPSPDMAIFINNIEEVRLSPRLQGSVVASTSQIMCSSSTANSEVFIVRPEDVIISCNATSNIGADTYADDMATSITANTFNRLQETPFSVNLPTTTAPMWLATILNSYMDGIAMTEQDTSSQGNPLLYAMGNNNSIGLYSNPFIQILAQQMNGYGGAWGWLRYQSLLQLDPMLHGDKTRVQRHRIANISTETSALNSYGIEASIAQSVSTSIRSWMYQANIATVSLQMTNLTLTGYPEVTFTDAVGPLSVLPDQIRNALLDTFVRNVTTLLMPQVTQNGNLECMILVSASHSGAITVVVTLGGGGAMQNPSQRFTFPAFMDNTFTPMLSRRNPTDTGSSAGEFLLAARLVRDSFTQNPLAPSMQTIIQSPAYSVPHTLPATPTHPLYGSAPATPQQASSYPTTRTGFSI